MATRKPSEPKYPADDGALTKKQVKQVKASAPKPATKPQSKPRTKTTWPRVTQGNHLTVTEYKDGRTELDWADDALLQEVRDALSMAAAKEMGNQFVETWNQAATGEANGKIKKTKVRK
jgi:hypothetical protein